jgi:hypothetical protein
MKRFVLAVAAAALLSLTVSPLLAGDPDFKTPEGIKKFFEDIQRDSN